MKKESLGASWADVALRIGLPGLLVVPVAVGLIAHFAAEPGGQVSVFGVSYTKRSVSGMEPGMPDKQPGEFSLEPGAAGIAVPDVLGKPLDRGLKALARAGFRIDPVEEREAWVPHGEILEQLPAAGSNASADGTTVHLVVANSQFRFRSERTLVSKGGEETRAEGEYRVKLVRSLDTGEVVGDFELVRGELSGLSASGRAFIDALEGSNVSVPLDSLDELNLSLSWSALAGQEKELEKKFAGGGEDKNAVTEALLLGLVGSQIGFDARAVLTSMPVGGGVRRTELELQGAKGILSSIRVEGPSVSTGPTRAFSVVRKSRQDPAYTKVGSARYSTSTGVLAELDISFERNEVWYRLRIERR